MSLQNEVGVSKKKKPDDLAKQSSLTWWIAFGFALSLPLAYWIWFGIIQKIPFAADAALWGSFGDFVGGLLNPVVAFCALYWLTRSIRIQKEELSATKEELAASRLAQQDQAKTLELQRFESTFFSLLAQHNTVLQSLRNTRLDRQKHVSSIKEVLDYTLRSHGSLEAAKVFLERNDELCGHYARILHQLLLLILMRYPGSQDKRTLNIEEMLLTPLAADEKMYAYMLRAFLDSEAAQLLALYCAYGPGDQMAECKNLIERYSMLEFMPFEHHGYSCLPLRELTKFFDRRAFGAGRLLELAHEHWEKCPPHFYMPGETNSGWNATAKED